MGIPAGQERQGRREAYCRNKNAVWEQADYREKDRGLQKHLIPSEVFGLTVKAPPLRRNEKGNEL